MFMLLSHSEACSTYDRHCRRRRGFYCLIVYLISVSLPLVGE